MYLRNEWDLEYTLSKVSPALGLLFEPTWKHRHLAVFLDLGQMNLLLSGTSQCYGRSLRAKPPRSTDAMVVRLDVVRHVQIHDQVDVLGIDAACRLECNQINLLKINK